jgi:hypothetical protein
MTLHAPRAWVSAGLPRKSGEGLFRIRALSAARRHRRRAPPLLCGRPDGAMDTLILTGRFIAAATARSARPVFRRDFSKRFRWNWSKTWDHQEGSVQAAWPRADRTRSRRRGRVARGHTTRHTSRNPLTTLTKMKIRAQPGRINRRRARRRRPIPASLTTP